MALDEAVLYVMAEQTIYPIWKWVLEYVVSFAFQTHCLTSLSRPGILEDPNGYSLTRLHVRIHVLNLVRVVVGLGRMGGVD